MKKQGIGFIFDMDGTLVDNMKYHFQAWEDFFVEMGKDIPVQKLVPIIAGKPSEEAIRITLGDGIPQEKVKEYVDRKEEIYRQGYGKWLEPVPGVIDFLENSRTLGIPMAVATSAPRLNIDFTIDGLDIRKYFDVIVGSEGIKKGKPDPEIFLIAARKLNILPEQCIVFEDSLIGVEAAIKAGMRVVVIATSFERTEFGKNSAALQIVENFLDLFPNDFLSK
jgi:beta-phosphoglucomutase family hydrolase